MEALFYVVPALMIALALGGLIALLRRARHVSHAWNSGLTAEARCLNTYTTTSGGAGDTMVSTTLHHVYEFATREGRPVRFEESGGPGTTVTGDVVTVHYAAEHPERATAKRPARGRLMAEQGCVVLVFGTVIVFSLLFMVAVHAGFGVLDDVTP